MCPLEDKRMDRDNILQELCRFKEVNRANTVLSEWAFSVRNAGQNE
jgi:hypothetical protein